MYPGIIRSLFLSGAVACSCAPAALAQHGGATSALYDLDNPVTITGEIVQVEWSAPRARLHVLDASTGKRWIIVGGSPTDLTAEQRSSVQIGTSARVTAYPARDQRCDPSCTAFGEKFTRADGSPLVMPPLPPHAH